jgi:integrase
MATSKEPIKLRKRLQPSGRTSLYLDIYLKGRRKTEFLHLYLVPENTRADKEKNRETMRLADAIRAKRVVDLQNGRFGFDDSSKLDASFLEYFRAQMNACRRHGTRAGWESTLRHLERYCSPNVTFRNITPEWVLGFKNYLETAHIIDRSKDGTSVSAQGLLTTSSKDLYFTKLKACIHRALEERILTVNPMRGIAGFKREEHERVYLTLEEVRKLAASYCLNPTLKRAFLFACLTGLRKSDVLGLTWGDVRRQGEFTRIVFRQQKTGGQEYIDISPQATAFMGERGEAHEQVFADFHYTNQVQKELKRWVLAVGINKDVTFHAARHTFAVLMLDLGADIYTVQKLLGHRLLQTTQIYAKVLDKKKQEAAMLIPQILPS